MARLLELALVEDNTQASPAPADKSLAIRVTGGRFAWPSSEMRERRHSAALSLDGAVVDGLDVAVRKGQLIGLCGAVGSGKTSVITALVGQMTRLAGTLELSGSIALVSQQAWIQSATVRDNILFGMLGPTPIRFHYL